MNDHEGRHRRPDDEQDGTATDRSVVDDAYVYALGTITEAERVDIERRLAAADEPAREWFRSIVSSVDEVMALTASTSAVEAPPALRSRVLAAVAEDARGSGSEPVAPVVSLDSRRRRRFRALAVAAAAAVVVGVGGAVVVQQTADSPSSPTSQVLAADDGRTATVDVTGGGTATVRWSRSEDTAVVTLDGLAPPGDGKVFEMWLIGEDPAPRPVGLVPADAASPDTEHVVTGLTGATTWAVTVEPETGSPAPTTTPIAAVTLDA